MSKKSPRFSILSGVGVEYATSVKSGSPGSGPGGSALIDKI